MAAAPASLALPELIDLAELLKKIFGSAEAAAEWLETANPVLGGHTPIEELTIRGAARVKVLVGRIEHGVYS